MKKVVVLLLTCIPAWACTYLAVHVFTDYSFGLFMWLPFVIGCVTTLIYGYKNPVATRIGLRNTSYLTLLVFSAGLLFFAWEGVVCLVMAAPIGILFTWIGYRTGYLILKTKVNNNSNLIVVLLFTSVPVLMAFEHSEKEEEQLLSVTTSVEINANSETVWENVVAFPQLKEPTEFIFKTGIAYPINATIEGKGVGAIRHCNFSTGSFVEPVTAWDKPKLLKFSVADQPETMKELSFYDIHPNHLHGYWVSKQGQFKLIQLPNGHTLLEGTTWYMNKIKPGFYWEIWSDYIVHKIHKRVLEHIRQQAEESNG